MEQGHGIGEYLRFFRSIPESVIARIASKEARENIHAIQKMTGKNRKSYRAAIDVLRKDIKDPHLNIIIGSIYLTLLTENAEKNPDKNIAAIIENLEIAEVNELIKKAENKIKTPQAFETFKQTVNKNPTLQSKFVALASYNE